MIHPLNKEISTITTADIYPIALAAVSKFCGHKSSGYTLPAFGTHVTLEDLAMDAVEKVVRANPMYITKTYVRIAARCVCIDKLKSKKLTFHSLAPSVFDGEYSDVSIEETVLGDAHDPLEGLEATLRAAMDPLQLTIYNELFKNKMYIEIAEDLKIPLRTLERHVQELKWMCEYILLELDPDTNPNSILFKES